MARCKSCDAPIAWLKTENDKPIPVNPLKVFVRMRLEGDAADKKVTVVLATGRVITGTEVTEAEAKVIDEGGLVRTKTGFISHFATCPNSKEHRRRT